MKNHFKLLALFVFIFSFFSNQFNCAQGINDSQVIESLEFREVDIKDVLRQLAKQYNLNIVFSEKVSGLITVQLANVTLEEALDSIITVNGFVYTKKGQVVKVTTAQEAQQEGRQTKLFKLNNANAVTLKDSLTKVLTPDGSVEADARSNSLLVTDTLSVINKIESMIPTLDEITPQVLIEAKLIETSLTNTEKLGIDWTTTMMAKGAKIPTTAPFTALDVLRQANGYVPLSNPSTESTSTSTTTGVGFPVGGVPPNLTGYPHSFPYSSSTDFTLGTLDFSAVQLIFDFLKQRQNTKLIANPRIVTLNNQKASIKVGKVLSLPKYTPNTNTGLMEITGWDPMNVGVNLEVTPQVSPDGHIRLKLKPEVSSFIGYTSNRNGVNEGPITSTRTAETEVLIRDGQTVVIGGLVKDEALTMVKKVPILGDIPFIGLFFTRKEVSSAASPTEKTDLLIFVTARILKDKNEKMLAWGSDLITSPPRPFKLGMKDIK